MKMGPSTGEQVLEQLLNRWPELCIIIVTGYPSLESMRATFKLRVFDYLAKPFSLSQLRQTLATRSRSSASAARRKIVCGSVSAIVSNCCALSATGH